MGKAKSSYNWAGTGKFAIWDSVTYETLFVSDPLFFHDDFITDAQVKASGLPGWTKKITGAAPPTTALVADQHGGIFALSLTSASQKQEAGIYFNDEHPLNLDKGPIIEIRAAVSTTPTSQTELYFGLANDYVEGPIAEADAGPTVHAFFCFDGSLACTIHTDDTSNDNNATSTGVTVTEGTYYIFRIDATTITDVHFYINGAKVAGATTFDMSTNSNVMVQPFLMAHKETEVGVGVLRIDYVKFWCGR